MKRAYLYVVDRDFGFAPNPFHGFCTLATCKPIIRRTAQVGDWIIGMGGSRLNATGRCIFAMRVDECVPYDDYWKDPRFRAKRPVRNGSRKMMVGDNIYHRTSNQAPWQQEDSHHSLSHGQPNLHNLRNDTQTNRVLISSYFFYFGKVAPVIPAEILVKIDYRNSRSHRVFGHSECAFLLGWLNDTYGKEICFVLGDPFDFDRSSKRYSVHDNKLN